MLTQRFPVNVCIEFAPVLYSINFSPVNIKIDYMIVIYMLSTHSTKNEVFHN